MTTLESGFDRKLKEAILDDVEAKLFGRIDNIVFNALQTANDKLRDYGNRYGYDADPIAESGHVVETNRSGNRVEVRVEWDHEAAWFFHAGTDAHMVEGNPVLSFIWEDAPADIHDMFPDTEREDGDPRVFFPEVHVEGIPASRFLDRFMKSIRAQLQPRGPGGRFA